MVPALKLRWRQRAARRIAANAGHYSHCGTREPGFFIVGLPDKETWEFLLAFPQKSYCGTYSMHLDLARYPRIRYLRAHWKMSRWAPREDSSPLFGFYLLAEEAKLQVMGA